VSNLDNVLNSIYCLSQEACFTVANLRLYPHIARISESHRLYLLLDELHAHTLEAFKASKLDYLDNDLDAYLSELVTKGSVIEETCGTLITTASLPSDHVLVRKLRSQVNTILLMLIKLSQISARNKTFDNRNFIAQ
jgi:hypothetical protein